VLLPAIPPRVEQRCQLPRIRIEAGRVRAFVQVTENASPREVLRAIITSVLPRDDVLDVKILRRECRLR